MLTALLWVLLIAALGFYVWVLIGPRRKILALIAVGIVLVLLFLPQFVQTGVDQSWWTNVIVITSVASIFFRSKDWDRPWGRRPPEGGNPR